MTAPPDESTPEALFFNGLPFETGALALFREQHRTNPLYRAFCDALRVVPDAVTRVEAIPALPISFFKTHDVQSGAAPPGATGLLFESSGTTGMERSRHAVQDAGLYEASLLYGFEAAYGPAEGWTILALLPSYLERKTSSLVHMAQVLMDRGRHPEAGFFLDDFAALAERLMRLEAAGRKTLLLGVTFALLDFAEQFPQVLRHTVVMETGGMKGRRTEWTREQVHTYLKERFGLSAVHSEYGMTELLSQAYAPEAGLFAPAATLRALVRDVQDPLDVRRSGTGALNFIDLANRYSCAFLATEDLGRVHADGRFEVLGRLDHSALRGCSLMAV